ncbi:hypothetical protein [Lacicoccus alkaliphilus]|uniref:Uncharacterized protein n=1 Tax=Lacicoccus alkaliphilus DSM 16010 TaxID=1123231 RepID=A0A1M7E7N6_9BACL|nr:hypothetical protein [Salinicoccus alkaliphilus]SHL87666.1 hypothetical protein SAMN02745189_01127 [Salinicoccus alkaliphilus DSM 16010]
MSTELNLSLLVEKLTAYQISRAVSIDMDLAQKIVDEEVRIEELPSDVYDKLEELNSKLMN